MVESPDPPRKLGLALSGGGFRASLFHAGVLARLAELGTLRQVDVISTVSGGSILGAYYYLHLKWLLEDPRRQPLGDDDYADLVRGMQRSFVRAIQRNLRSRMFINPWKNLLLALPRYSRSDRMGDLYDRHLYNPAWKAARAGRYAGLVNRQIRMDELEIHPADPDATVPELVLNATSLNTGHNWRFRVAGMGEERPADPDMSRVAAEIDKNTLLEAGEYGELPGTLGRFPLGKAVAASACVPGTFPPLSITGLYEGFRVQLVDGGVQDNQGIQALFDSGCTHLIVSDASGQMQDAPYPGTHAVGVLGRSTSIYGSRVRAEQLTRASERVEGAATTRAVALLHLRKGLPRRVLGPLPDSAGQLDPAEQFDVSPAVQARLARVRTDLDAFSDVEACSLMLDGYRMVDGQVTSANGFGTPLVQSGSPLPDPARFGLAAADALAASGAPDQWYLDRLSLGSVRFAKPMHILLGPILRTPRHALARFTHRAADRARPLRERSHRTPGWLVLLPQLAAAALAVYLVVRFAGDSIADALSARWPAGWTLLGVALLVMLGLYAMSKKGNVLTRLLFDCLLPPVVAMLLLPLSLIELLTTPVFLRLGRFRPR
ncbi:MAG TPA: patatin-like phospholipase family protein [Thermoleophilaceae bacterium]|nr:patatin-like phospholipase family protein [Thermoleophilaceae bacterium]